MNKPVYTLFAYPYSLCFISLLLVLSSCTFNKRSLLISSPDNSYQLTVSTKAGQLHYSVSLANKVLIEDTPLGLFLDSEWIGRRVRLGKAKDSVYTHFTDQGPVAVRAADIPILHRKSGIRYVLAVRISALGFAYRYELSAKENDLKDYQKLVEKGSWKLPKETDIWYTPYQQESVQVKNKPVKDLMAKEVLSLPLILSLQKGDHYLRLSTFNESSVHPPKILNEGNNELFLQNVLAIEQGKMLKTPWKISYMAGDLSSLYKSPFFPGIREESIDTESNFSWVKGGNLLRVPISPGEPDSIFIETYQRAAIDWDFPYLSLERGWEEWPSNWKRVKRVAEKSPGLGIWVWKSMSSLLDPIERRQFFRQAKFHLVKGVVIAWNNREERQSADTLLTTLFQDAAEFNQMILLRANAAYTPFSTTSPNFMGITRRQEGASLSFPSRKSISKVVLTADLLPEGYVQRTGETGRQDPQVKTAFTLANLLHTTANIREWEGIPTDFSFHPEQDFLSGIPTGWEEGLILPITQLGKRTAIARKKGDSWYVAIQNGAQTTRESFSCDFLGDGRYKVKLIKDSPGKLEKLLHKTMVIDSSHWEEVYLPAGGGMLAHFQRTSLPLQEIKLSYTTPQLAEPMKLKVDRVGAARTVRYTLDGSDPGRRSTLYKRSLNVARPLICKMAAFRGRERMFASTEAAFVSFPGPDIQAADSIFWDEMEVQIWNESGIGEILYTLNGRSPSRKSARYRKPILLKKTATLTASILLSSGVQSSVQQRTFTRVEALKGDSLLNPKKGLTYYLFPEEENIPNRISLDELPASQQGLEKYNFSKLLAVKDSSFSILYKGFLKAEVANLYTLDVRTNGNVQLLVGDRLVLEAYTDGYMSSASGFVGLEEGFHPITLLYSQHEGTPTLELTWGHPNMERQTLEEALFYEAE